MSQQDIIDCLKKKKILCIKELVEIIGTGRASLTTAMRKLVDEEIVFVVGTKYLNRRRYYYSLTKEGREQC